MGLSKKNWKDDIKALQSLYALWVAKPCQPGGRWPPKRRLFTFSYEFEATREIPNNYKESSFLPRPKIPRPESQARILWCIHGLPKVSLGPTMPYRLPLYVLWAATPETAYRGSCFCKPHAMQSCRVPHSEPPAPKSPPPQSPAHRPKVLCNT
jgi:hypothetical protein